MVVALMFITVLVAGPVAMGTYLTTDMSLIGAIGLYAAIGSSAGLLLAVWTVIGGWIDRTAQQKMRQDLPPNA